MTNQPNHLPIEPAAAQRHLALEEALLDYAEETQHPGFLHFWESEQHFVVLGYSRAAAAEAHLDLCAQLAIPVLRRSSGGGTVLQGPGCLNYTLVLPIDSSAEFETITSTNCAVIRRHRDLLTELLARPVQARGDTDLVLDGRKFSGNSQRRKRRCFLFHGAFLLGLDLTLIERLLKMPRQQPEYRQQRAHRDFLTHLPLDPTTLQRALAQAWATAAGIDPHAPIPPRVLELREALWAAKYRLPEWNLKF